MRFHFGDIVTVTEGFYKGAIGRVTGYNNSKDAYCVQLVHNCKEFGFYDKEKLFKDEVLSKRT